jgi:hypothetical protein
MPYDRGRSAFSEALIPRAVAAPKISSEIRERAHALSRAFARVLKMLSHQKEIASDLRVSPA